MLRQFFKVEHLRADCRKLLQQPALAAACGAADRRETKARRKRSQVSQHLPPIGAVATFELSRRAIQRAPECASSRRCDCRRASNRPGAARSSASDQTLFPDGARYCVIRRRRRVGAPRTRIAVDPSCRLRRARVAKHRAVNCAWQMIEREFAFAANVDQRVELLQAPQRVGRRDLRALRPCRAIGRHEVAVIAWVSCSARVRAPATRSAESSPAPARWDGYGRPERNRSNRRTHPAGTAPAHVSFCLATLPKCLVEPLRVLASVVRRDSHTGDQNPCTRCLAGANHRRQVFLHPSYRQPAQSVVRAQFDDEDRGPMLLQQCRQASSGRRLLFRR